MKRLIKLSKLVGLCLAVIAVLSIVTAYLPFILISGSSMEPTFKDGQLVPLERHFKDVNRGDVVIFRQKVHFAFEEKLIKRVCGIPGDIVYKDNLDTYFIYDGNDIYYYDKKVSSNTALLEASTKQFVLEDNEYFCMGDNRDESIDSRTFGAIGKEKIIAIVKDRYEIPKMTSWGIK